jgi:hypothetical protein
VLVNFASLRSAYESTIDTMNYPQVMGLWDRVVTSPNGWQLTKKLPIGWNNFTIVPYLHADSIDFRLISPSYIFVLFSYLCLGFLCDLLSQDFAVKLWYVVCVVRNMLGICARSSSLI